MKKEVTAILLSWKRKPNMPKIIKAIRNQTVPTEIWLINNNGKEDFGADRLICFWDCVNDQPWNLGEWARYVFSRRIQTTYGMFQDDDFMLGDNKFLEDAIKIHEERCPEHFLGVAGRGFRGKYPHYRPDIVNQSAYAAILKGHFQLWRKDTLTHIHLSAHPSASDIYWSMDMSHGERVHWVDSGLSKRLKTLERFGVGYEFRSGHYQERDRVCAAYKKEYMDAR